MRLKSGYPGGCPIPSSDAPKHQREEWTEYKKVCGRLHPLMDARCNFQKRRSYDGQCQRMIHQSSMARGIQMFSVRGERRGNRRWEEGRKGGTEERSEEKRERESKAGRETIKSS